eukprot:4710166-Pyramimonas_sp.AAC.1
MTQCAADERNGLRSDTTSSPTICPTPTRITPPPSTRHSTQTPATTACVSMEDWLRHMRCAQLFTT